MTYQPPQQQYVYQQVVKPPSNGMAVTALILGIVAIVIGIWSPIPFVGIGAAFFAFLPAVLAVIFGHVGAGTAKKVRVGKGMATTGLVLGYLTLGLIVAVTIFWIIAGAVGSSSSSTM
ncbi:hypothetical protein MUN78_16515 [Leucobacter allii]|uniref:DUF4190 domain-containing protein n=1 Tax=Leucobacter allii TaxID=2932247 RepID=A0ABY4FLS9_9MICO|nr:hypothetical protein [Leucobacter allii]UOQ57234.1 hypothetical protein MUN78_16515 [Leucobacter allii]